MDPVLTRHKLLLTTISDNLGNTGPEYDSFIEHMKGYVPRGILASKKTLLDKFDALAIKGHLKPGKYDVLKKICEGSGNHDIKELVEAAEVDIKTLQHGNPATKTERIASGTPIQETLSDQQQRGLKRQRKDSSDPLYSVDRKNRGFYDPKGKRGLLLILNSEENRKGTEKDVENLKTFFGNDGLHFNVYDPRSQESEDLTTEKLDQVLEEVQRQLNGHLGKCYYCFICVILSHGNENGIKTKDGLKSIDDIRESFNNQQIPNFTGRPKVFLIQACRGIEQQSSQEIDDADDIRVSLEPMVPEIDEADELIQVPTDADILLAFATTLGYKSFRRVSIGSWFITECIRVFREYYTEDHLEDMLITVRERVALGWTKQDGAKQMPCVWSTLTKRLMLCKSDI